MIARRLLAVRRLAGNAAQGNLPTAWPILARRSRSSPPAGSQQWPAEIYYHDIPVVRLHPPPRGRWSTWRWTRGLARWIERHADEFDVVCVWGLMHEARAVVHAVVRAKLQTAQARIPVVLVPERIGWHGDCFRQVRISGGRQHQERLPASSCRGSQQRGRAAGVGGSRIFAGADRRCAPGCSPHAAADVRNAVRGTGDAGRIE